MRVQFCSPYMSSCISIFFSPRIEAQEASSNFVQRSVAQELEEQTSSSPKNWHKDSTGECNEHFQVETFWGWQDWKHASPGTKSWLADFAQHVRNAKKFDQLLYRIDGVEEAREELLRKIECLGKRLGPKSLIRGPEYGEMPCKICKGSDCLGIPQWWGVCFVSLFGESCVAFCLISGDPSPPFPIARPPRHLPSSPCEPWHRPCGPRARISSAYSTSFESDPSDQSDESDPVTKVSFKKKRRK